jgi:Secretion system C-terminal sorting domain
MKTVKLTFIISALILFIGINDVNAQCLVDQSQIVANAARSARNLAGYYEGQSFTAGSSGYLCEVDMLMSNTMSGTGTLNIYDGNGITGTLLATQTVNVYVPTGQVWQAWYINTPPLLTSGNQYTFQFVPIQGSGLPDPYAVMLSSTNVYPGGTDLAVLGWDLAFKTYIGVVSTETTDIEKQNIFEIFPNPSQGSFTLQTSASINAVTIFNSIGEAVCTPIVSNEFSNEIDMTGYPKGIYFIQIHTEGNIFTEKIILQ